MFIYPRDRYISLLRADPTPPETRLEDIVLHWTAVIKRFLDLHAHGVIRYSLTYEDLTQRSEHALQAVATACHVPVNDLDDALAILEHDSQAGTDLSGKLLREQSVHELTEDDLRRAQATAQRHGLEPDIALHLPAHLLNSKTYYT